MFCKNCGYEIKNEKAVICTSCGSKVSDESLEVTGSKSKVCAALLAFFLGGVGAHRFYLGHNGTGAVFVILFILGFFTGLTFIATGIWSLIDFILILCGALKPADGTNYKSQ